MYETNHFDIIKPGMEIPNLTSMLNWTIQTYPKMCILSYSKNLFERIIRVKNLVTKIVIAVWLIKYKQSHCPKRDGLKNT